MARQVRRISELPEATELSGDELIEIVQDGDNYRLRVDQLPGGGGGGDVSTVAGVSPVSGDVPAADLKAALDVPESPSDIGAATAAQGALADTAVQPADLAGYERALTPGANITIDRTNPANPVISAAGGGGTTGGWDTLATPAISAGALTLDLSEPTLFAVGLDQNVTDLSFANLPSGKAPAFAVAFTQDATGGHTVAWPANVIGTPPDIGSDPGAVTVVSLAYIGGGKYVISGAIYA